jgi:hypothetical protein
MIQKLLHKLGLVPHIPKKYYISLHLPGGRSLFENNCAVCGKNLIPGLYSEPYGHVGFSSKLEEQ